MIYKGEIWFTYHIFHATNITTAHHIYDSQSAITDYSILHSLWKHYNSQGHWYMKEYCIDVFSIWSNIYKLVSFKIHLLASKVWSWLTKHQSRRLFVITPCRTWKWSLSLHAAVISPYFRGCEIYHFNEWCYKVSRNQVLMAINYRVHLKIKKQSCHE